MVDSLFLLLGEIGWVSSIHMKLELEKNVKSNPDRFEGNLGKSLMIISVRFLHNK